MCTLLQAPILLHNLFSVHTTSSVFTQPFQCLHNLTAPVQSLQASMQSFTTFLLFPLIESKMYTSKYPQRFLCNTCNPSLNIINLGDFYTLIALPAQSCNYADSFWMPYLCSHYLFKLFATHAKVFQFSAR